MTYYSIYKNYYTQQKNIGKFRKLPELNLDKEIIDFSTNDYLNLSNSASLLEAGYQAGIRHGIGSTGSRLLSGNKEIFEQAEYQIAHDKHTTEAMIFSSGYQANISVLSALLDKSVLHHRALVFFDRLNHSSLYQAVFLSGAELVRYAHNDLNHLSDLLQQYKNDTRSKFIISETLYGMDGDIIPLKDIVDLVNKYHCFLYLDEAHATGILGEHGYGLSTTLKLDHIPHVIMGSFSKAVGVCGAYIACNKIIKNYLLNRCHGFIYSTALSPMVIGAVLAAWTKIKELTQERLLLLARANHLRLIIKKMNFDTGNSNTHIIPIILQDEKTTLEIQKSLKEKKILVSAIRPPTVPPNTARLRIALTLKHGEYEIKKLLSALKEI